jgi:hypothetical protein
MRLAQMRRRANTGSFVFGGGLRMTVLFLLVEEAEGGGDDAGEAEGHP